MVIKKKYESKNKRKKIMLKVGGKEYIQNLIDLAIEDKEIEPSNSGFYKTINDNIDVVWDYFWEDISEGCY